MKSVLENIIRSRTVHKKTGSLVVIVGNIHTKLHGNITDKTFNEIDHKLSYWFQGAQYSKAFKNDVWDGFIHLFRPKTQMFPSGFLKDVEKILSKRKIKYRIVDKRQFLIVPKEKVLSLIPVTKFKRPRPYQKKAVVVAFKKGQGVINIPTGTGKTLIINLIIFVADRIKKTKHLIITSGISLLTQLKEEIEKFQKEPVGFVGHGEWDVKRITVAGIETINKRLSISPLTKSILKIQKRKEALKLLSSANAVFLDEAHHAPAKTFRAVTSKVSNASLRISTTATYLRSSGDTMLLHAVTGGVIFKKTLSWMIDKGYLAKPTIILLEYDEKQSPDLEEEWCETYYTGVSANQRRNLVLARTCRMFMDAGLSTILFVQHKNQGSSIERLLINQLRAKKNEIAYLTGSSDLEMQRKPALKLFKKGIIRNLICTRILGEGMDFPEANAGIRASAQKFEGNILQQLGRILRKYKNPLAPDVNRSQMQRVFWFDLCDMHNPKLAKHSLERIKTYESEQAFDVKYIYNFSELEKLLQKKVSDAKIIKRKLDTSYENKAHTYEEENRALSGKEKIDL